MLHYRRDHLLSPFPPLRQGNYLHGWLDAHVLLPYSDWRSRLGQRQERSAGCWHLVGHFDSNKYDHHWTGLLSHCRGDTIRETEVQDDRHWKICVQPHWNL